MYLRDINVRSLGPGHHHDLEVVELCERPLGGSSGLVSGVVQDAVHLVLERLSQRVTGSGLELVAMGLVDDLYHLKW